MTKKLRRAEVGTALAACIKILLLMTGYCSAIVAPPDEKSAGPDMRSAVGYEMVP
jgi:hypothetical protein